MARHLSIVALGALCCLLSGCGCSREKGEEAVATSRMEDAAYTNQLITLHGSRKAIAKRAEAIRAKLAALGANASNHPAYADLTNQLARCEAEAAKIRNDALVTVRARVLKEGGVPQKGDLKK